MDINNKIKNLFKIIDRMDAASFSSFLTDDVKFRFGNMPAVEGKDNVVEAVSGFYGSIRSLSHDIDNIWENEGVVVCNGTVTYTRHDSSKLSVPFANIFKMKGDRIKEYLIYADISELYK
ncbi:MAG: nuclear transport factor 2 family protein [Bacteroidales bacterium]